MPTREIATRAYFQSSEHNLKLRGAASLIISALLILVGISVAPGSGGITQGCIALVFFVPGITLGLLGGLRLLYDLWRNRGIRTNPDCPSDDEIQRLIDEGIESARNHALDSLGLSDGHLAFEPLTIIAPLLWRTEGVHDDELVFRRGKDGELRFGVYSITIIALAERHIAAFTCSYRLIYDDVVNVRICEYQYHNIVSVSVSEKPSSLRFVSGEEISTAQEFRVSVQNGEAIRITIDAPAIRRLTGADSLPSTGVERAVRAIRAALRDRNP